MPICEKMWLSYKACWTLSVSRTRVSRAQPIPKQTVHRAKIAEIRNDGLAKNDTLRNTIWWTHDWGKLGSS